MGRVYLGDGTVRACTVPTCDGPRRARVGGVAWGGCPACLGTGLILSRAGDGAGRRRRSRK